MFFLSLVCCKYTTFAAHKPSLLAVKTMHQIWLRTNENVSKTEGIFFSQTVLSNIRESYNLVNKTQHTGGIKQQYGHRVDKFPDFFP